MTGPGHYREAELLLEEASRTSPADDKSPWLIWRANAHATLALAAATALCQPNSDGLIAPPEWRAWNQAAGTEQP